MVLPVHERDYYVERYTADQHSGQREQVTKPRLLSVRACSNTSPGHIRPALRTRVIVDCYLGITLATLRHRIPLLTVMPK